MLKMFFSFRARFFLFRFLFILAPRAAADRASAERSACVGLQQSEASEESARPGEGGTSVVCTEPYVPALQPVRRPYAKYVRCAVTHSHIPSSEMTIVCEQQQRAEGIPHVLRTIGAAPPRDLTRTEKYYQVLVYYPLNKASAGSTCRTNTKDVPS